MRETPGNTTGIPQASRERTRPDRSDVQVRTCIATEPKDFARAALLLFDVCTQRGDAATAEAVRSMFDVPGVVAYATALVVRAIVVDERPDTPENRDAAASRIDDLTRLAVLASGDGRHDVFVERLGDLSAAVRSGDDDPKRRRRVEAAGSTLIELVNAFFFDRLTAIPALRDYVVDLELGL